jgi:hypothetical protein
MSPAESKSVVVVGSINEDVVLHLGRNIQPGETVTAERIERLPGGKGANQAVAAAAAGARVAMIGAVGDDPAGIRMVDDLRGRGVRTESVRTAKGVSTGAAYITVTPDGENTSALAPGSSTMVFSPSGVTVMYAAPVLTPFAVRTDSVLTPRPRRSSTMRIPAGSSPTAPISATVAPAAAAATA